MKEIFANQILNTYNFGRLYIKSNGNVFTKGNKISIGNIKKDTIKRIVLNEISIGYLRLNIRTNQPCSDVFINGYALLHQTMRQSLVNQIYAMSIHSQ